MFLAMTFKDYMKHKVSVIIACYNEERMIGACLSSLEKQDYKPLEILVVDDGSTDTTPEIIKGHPVKYIRLEHAGTAVARNTAAAQASGTVLSFLDADMEFEPDFITHLVAPVNAGESKGTFSKLEYVKNWDNPLARCYNRNNNPPLPDRLRIPQDREEGDDFRAILKSEFMRVNGFDNTGYTDTWTLAKKLGYKSTNALDAKYYHHNPDTYDDIYRAARWIGKRRYKWGVAGTLITMIRTNAFVSFLKGLAKASRYKEPAFVPFQLAYDAGIFSGAFESLFTASRIK